jgi:LysM repeat protein
LTLFVSISPISVGAFWPFPSAQADDETGSPILHDATIELLASATNIDPNPSKGDSDIEMTGGSALLANSGPEGTIPPSSAVSGSGSISLYEVQEGDSISEIADMFGVSVNTVLSANNIKDAKTIQPGDTLKILPVSGVVYTVKRGGTLSDVAELFDVEVEELTQANGMDAGDSLAAGTELIVPGGTSLPAKKAAPKSSTSSGVAVVKKTLPSLSGYFTNPLPGAHRSQGIHGHNGVDLAGMPMGSSVVAAAAGTVIEVAVGDYNGGYGNYVDVRHANGVETRYAHLSSIAVAIGQQVAKGEKLGGVGNTGKATGIHLHFEVHGAANPF